MKIRTIALVVLSLALLSSRAYSADLGLARMGIVQGDVQIYSEDAGDWVPAATNTPLGQGNRIWVPVGGRSELQILGGLVLRLDNSTALDILSLDDKAYQFYVDSGRIYLNNRSGRVDLLQFDTPVSSINCSETSTVLIDVEENGTTEISVLEGYAFAETRNGRIDIPSGRTLRIRENLQTEMYSFSFTDEWLEWNRDLDGRFSETGDSLRYLPEELNDYGYDLDNNGTWFQDASYGYVWTPSIAVSINWAPYHYGRWVWIGGNYVWISYERWGWAPYHYGRWIFLRHAGWCWVPPRRGAVHWGPGYVGWIHTANYVSWVPLAPGETYYGHGYYGPGSVNINTLQNRTFPANRNFINRNARNAVRVMHRDTFLHGRPVAVPAKENPFNQSNVGIGPPRFKPDRETHAPVLKKIPFAKQPPQRIRRISTETLRQERKPAAEKRRPVFTPEKPARELPATIRETPTRMQREQRPDIYTYGRQEQKQEQPLIKYRQKLETPVREKKTVTTPAPTAPTKTREATTTNESRRQQQPAAIKVAPQPVAQQPVAARPAWTPEKPRQAEKAVSPVRQQPVATRPAWTTEKPQQAKKDVSPIRQQPRQTSLPQVRQPVPVPSQGQAAPAQPRQLQNSPQLRRQSSQAIQQPQPVVEQPVATQPPATQQATPAVTPQSRQQGRQPGNRPSLQNLDGRGPNH